MIKYATLLSRTRFGLGEGLFGSFAQRYEILLGRRHKIISLQDLNLRLATILVLHHVVSDAHTTEDQTAWGAPPPDKVIAHTNLYWPYQTAPGRTAGTANSKDVDFGGPS